MHKEPAHKSMWCRGHGDEGRRRPHQVRDRVAYAQSCSRTSGSKTGPNSVMTCKQHNEWSCSSKLLAAPRQLNLCTQVPGAWPLRVGGALIPENDDQPQKHSPSSGFDSRRDRNRSGPDSWAKFAYGPARGSLLLSSPNQRLLRKHAHRHGCDFGLQSTTARKPLAHSSSQSNFSFAHQVVCQQSAPK